MSSFSNLSHVFLDFHAGFVVVINESLGEFRVGNLSRSISIESLEKELKFMLSNIMIHMSDNLRENSKIHFGGVLVYTVV